MSDYRDHNHNDQNNRRRRMMIGRMNSMTGNDDTAGSMSSENDSAADVASTGSMIVASANQDPVLDERFRVACGVTGEVVVTIRHRERPMMKSVRHVMRHPSALIGRGSHCDISLQDPTVSYRHAYLQLIDAQLFCFDLGSRSGTFCRSDRHREGPLALGDEVFIGPFSLSVSSQNPEALEGDGAWDVTPLSAEQMAALNESQGTPFQAVVKFLNGSPRPKPFSLNRPVTLVGKRSPCRIKLTDDSVSRVHCSFVRTTMGIWLVDLLGRGGTLVKGERVQRVPLNEGDEITVGGFRMQLQAAATSRDLMQRNTELTRAQQPSHAADPNQRTEQKRIGKRETDLQPRPNPTLIPPSDGRPAESGGTESTFSESFVYSLVDQFSAMQQQMFEQSQQTMTAMAKILQSRHEIEVELVRDEMAHIRGLSKELQELSRQLAERQLGEIRAEAAAPQSAAEEAESARAAAEAQMRLAGIIEQVDQSTPSEEPVVETQEQSVSVEGQSNIAQGTGEPSADAADSEATGVDHAAVPPAGDTPLQGEEAAVEEVAAESERDTQVPETVPAGTTESGDIGSDEDPHIWLSQRIAAIEKERSSRWKKITRILTGAGADDRLGG